MALRLLVQKAADERLIVATAAAFLLVSIASLFVLFRLDTNDWISIDPIQRKVFRIYKLFGCSVYRKVYDLSQFDRISLHRVPRGGYRATLVGREQEVVLSVSWKLDWVRHAAAQAASAIGLQMSDQLRE